jgi:hypothetical protein
MAAWIRILIPNADPDPGGLEMAKKEGKNLSKRQKIRHKKDKINVIGITWVIFPFYFIKSKHLSCLLINLCFLTCYLDLESQGSEFIFKTGSRSAIAYKAGSVSA